MSMPESLQPPGQTDAPVLSAAATRARRRALIAITTVVALLVVLWFSDSLAGLLPTQPYHATTQAVGDYRVTLSLTPAQLRAGTPIAAQIALVDAQHQPFTDATVTYAWEMPSMDMGVATGHADPTSAKPGTYATQMTAAMGGIWRLTLHIHRPNRPDAATTFAIHVHS
ncbi:MAG: FixH family protein [Ktedonobacterales bacterium]|nr:FixH family protein [Ktedonobacterales bacterium]